MSWQRIQRKIQFQHINARLAENAPLARFRMLNDQIAHGFGRQPARSGDSRDLIIGGGRADVRIEATG